MYKNNLVIHAGETKFNKKQKKRACLNDILVFNIDSKELHLIRTVGDNIESRRNHATALMGSYLVIYGGITDNESYVTHIGILNLGNFQMAV